MGVGVFFEDVGERCIVYGFLDFKARRLSYLCFRSAARTRGKIWRLVPYISTRKKREANLHLEHPSSSLSSHIRF